MNQLLFGGASVTSYVNAETGVLLGRMSTQPNAARVTLIDNFISGMKTDGLWTKMDRVQCLAAHATQAAQPDWKASAKSISEAGSMTFTVDRGYSVTAQALGNYLDMGEVFSGGATGNAATTTDAHISVYFNTYAIAAGYEAAFEFASAAGEPGQTSLGNVGTGPRLRFQFNDSTFTADGLHNPATANENKGFWCLNRRTTGPIRQLWHDTQGGAPLEKLNEDATAATGFPTGNARYLHGSHTVQHDGAAPGTILGFITQGVGLSDVEVDLLRTRILTFLTAIGAN